MKKHYFFAFLLVANFAIAQKLKIHKLLPPESKEYSDLDFLKQELAGKGIVMLGEQTHAYGNIFEMKIRIIEYLHQNLGFNTIAIESPFYDIYEMNKKGFSKKEFNKAIFGVWSNTPEFQRLVDYIEANNLKVIGFDSQITNAKQFVDDFYTYCTLKKININLNKNDLGIIMEALIDNVMYDNTDIKYEDYEMELKKVIASIKSLKSTDENYHWLQFAKSLLATSKDAYYNKEDILTADFGNENYNFRDAQMADNLLSYIKRNTNEKIVVWADNIHVINSMETITKPVLKEFIPMGSHVKKELKEKVYSLATIHANDSLYSKSKWYKTPILKGSFEDKLKSLNIPYLFVSANQKEMMQPQKHRLLHYTDFTESRLDKLHDGYVFLRNATEPKNEYIASGKDTIIAILNNDSRKEKVTVFKGKIIDKTTKEVIPYTNLIVKKQQIYRIADENGNYKLPVISNRDIVTISSMGYETKHIPIKDLSKKIYLTPSFEALNEVVIKAKVAPKVVLSNAVKAISKNHPTTHFNSKRYIHNLVNIDGETILDYELIAKQYDLGYRQDYTSTRNFEKVRWNIDKRSKNKKAWAAKGGFRENAIQYGNIFHKRKHKKFEVSYVKSTNPKDEDYYILSFKVNRNKWNYTNRVYPTTYSGKIYIKKDTYAIVKILESWETTLDKKDIDKYKGWLGEQVIKNGYKQIRIKEENINDYSNVIDGKHYIKTMFKRTYSEALNKKDELEISVTESTSEFTDIETKKVEEIAYVFRQNISKILNNLKKDDAFWKAFDAKRK